MNQKTLIVQAAQPAIMYAGMLWFDTDDDKLKERNAANNAWIERPGVTLAATISGLWTFSRGANVPFAVAAASLKVTNLDVDLLDGQHRVLKINADHAHSGAGAEGGTLDWDDIWSDAVHDHSAAGEGGQLDWDIIWSDAVHSHQAAGEGGTLDVAAIASGILSVARGGTGLGAFAQGGILYISAANTLSRLAPAGANLVLRSTGANALELGSLVAADIPNITTAKLTDVPTAAWATIFNNAFTIATVLTDHNKAAHDALSITPEEMDPSPDVNDTGSELHITTDTVGENVDPGEVLYLKNDGKYWLADADGVATMPALVMAMETILANNAGKLLHSGYFRHDAWNWALGSGEANLLWASVTPGAMSQTQPVGAGDQVQVLGYVRTADIVFFSPSFELVEVPA